MYFRMHLALKAYHELLHTINAMSQSKDAQLRDNANVIKGRSLCVNWKVKVQILYSRVIITLAEVFPTYCHLNLEPQRWELSDY